MIKAIRFIPMAALLALAACTQEELPQDSTENGFRGVITFSSPYTATRSDALRDGSFQEGDQVGVLGYCQASNTVNGETVDYSSSPWDTKKEFATPEVFYNQMLEYEGTGSWTYTWTGTGNIGNLHPWYEDDDYTYAFFAYYPYAEVNSNEQGKIPYYNEDGTVDESLSRGTIQLSGEDDRGDPTITYTMPFSEGNYTSQRSWWLVPDLMLAYKVDHLHADGSVRLNFRHIFSAIEFEVNNYNPYPIQIDNLYFGSGNEEEQIGGFYQSVKVTGQQSDYEIVEGKTFLAGFKLIGRDDDEDEHILTNLYCKSATTSEDGEVISATRVPVEYKEDKAVSLLFIPDATGSLTEDNNQSLYIRISISLPESGSGGEHGNANERVFTLGNQSFAPGVRSIFSINVIGNDIYVQVRSDGTWEDDGDSDIVFE